MAKVVGFCASRSNSGKTTLILRILEEFKRRGIKASVLKHGQHMESGGKDSSRFASAGAEASMFVSPHGWMLESHPDSEISMQNAIDMLAVVSGSEVIIVEGYKRENHKKIAVCRAEISLEIPNNGKGVCAVVSDSEMDTELPVFGFDELGKICDFILE